MTPSVSPKASVAISFTVSSYNCGGLRHHYDYLRGGCMEGIMRDRYSEESRNMRAVQDIQKLSLKMRFSPNPEEVSLAQQEWANNKCERLFRHLTSGRNKLNVAWGRKVREMITPYRETAPPELLDVEVNEKVDQHMKSFASVREVDSSSKTRSYASALRGDAEGLEVSYPDLDEVCARMARDIFQNTLNHDIICIQEGSYLSSSAFPGHYEVLFETSGASKNGIAWNTQRFNKLKTIELIAKRAFAISLQDKMNGAIVLVASVHVFGCNPFRPSLITKAKAQELDSKKGDDQLREVVGALETEEADIKVIGMDSNVTSVHPRLDLLKELGYRLDYNRHLYPTCTHPGVVLDLRIDWIAFKAKDPLLASIANIPVEMGLNHLVSNISDHKPVAAEISY